MLFASPVDAATEGKLPSKTQPREQLSITPEEAMKAWSGDLDGMIERRFIRILTVYSKTFYFADKGVQRGAVYDIGRQFEEDLNKKLAKERKLKQKHLKMQVLFIPVARGELLSALAAGKGDIAASNLTITDARSKLVDFSVPVYPDVSEVVISGPGTTAPASVDDLAGMTVFVRKSSSYYESLVALNQRFAGEKKPAVIIKEAPETLEDEDLPGVPPVGLVGVYPA